jgi:hypothetical protein
MARPLEIRWSYFAEFASAIKRGHPHPTPQPRRIEPTPTRIYSLPRDLPAPDVGPHQLDADKSFEQRIKTGQAHSEKRQTKSLEFAPQIDS